MSIIKLDEWGVKSIDTNEIVSYNSLQAATEAAEQNKTNRYVDKWAFIDVKKKVYIDDNKLYFNLEKNVDLSDCAEDTEFLAINSVRGGAVYEPKSLSELEELATKFMADTMWEEDYDVVYRKVHRLMDSDQDPMEDWIIDS